jgi:hypothetical protein
MFKFEIKIMIIGIGAQSDFLNNNLGSIGFYSFCFFLVRKETFCNQGFCKQVDLRLEQFQQGQDLFFSQSQSFFVGIMAGFHIIPYYPYYGGFNLFINVMRVFRFYKTSSGSWSKRCCYT